MRTKFEIKDNRTFSEKAKSFHLVKNLNHSSRVWYFGEVVRKE